MWWSFILGLFVGGSGGLVVFSLCHAASDGDYISVRKEDSNDN